MNRFFSRRCRVLTLALLLLSPLTLSCSTKKYQLPVKTLTIQKQDGSTVTVQAELAIRQEERNYGFMNRKNIPDGTGMFFVFEKDQVLRFWMKNTPHPLTIAYIDSTGTITDILDMEPFDLSDVSSSRSVRYALEVPQGWYKKAGVSTGDKVFIDSDTSLKKYFSN